MESAEDENARQQYGGGEQPVAREITGVEDGDHQNRADVVHDGQRQQEHLHLSRNAIAQQR